METATAQLTPGIYGNIWHLNPASIVLTAARIGYTGWGAAEAGALGLEALADHEDVNEMADAALEWLNAHAVPAGHEARYETSYGEWGVYRVYAAPERLAEVSIARLEACVNRTFSSGYGGVSPVAPFGHWAAECEAAGLTADGYACGYSLARDGEALGLFALRSIYTAQNGDTADLIHAPEGVPAALAALADLEHQITTGEAY